MNRVERRMELPAPGEVQKDMLIKTTKFQETMGINFSDQLHRIVIG